MIPPVRILLQARTESQRLPAKALLPLGGVPSAVLAGKRAARGGGDVLLAIPDAAADDPLAAAAGAAGLPVFRGARDDVLGRFAAAARDLPDAAIVVRLTGDNVVPDADLVADLVAALTGSDRDIVGVRWPDDRLPYGVSAEAMRLGALRAAHARADDPHGREHVTPWLWRHARGGGMAGLAEGEDLSRLRGTLDTLDDYLRLCRVFDGLRDPVAAPWRELVRRLAALPDAPRFDMRGALVLGTAQLAEPYGSAGRTQPPGRGEAVAIVRRAVAHGVAWIDTARAYGGSEARIGAALAGGRAAQVATKLDPLAGLPPDATETAVRAAVDASLFRSCRELRCHALDTLLLHRADHLRAWNGAVWRRLQELRAEGVVGRLGVSVRFPAEAAAALAEPDVRHMQLPYNLLDSRWEKSGVIERFAARPDVTVHARSAFLQGVLLRGAEAWPRIGGVDAAALAGWLRRAARDCGRLDAADLCLAWVRAQPWISGVVVGVESLDQLDRNLERFARPALDPEARRRIAAERPSVPERLLDPALW